jgi:hypothetical protein
VGGNGGGAEADIERWSADACAQAEAAVASLASLGGGSPLVGADGCSQQQAAAEDEDGRGGSTGQAGGGGCNEDLQTPYIRAGTEETDGIHAGAKAVSSL